MESPSVQDETKLERFLVSMPKKFRKSLWVKRGDFVVIAPIQEGDKVKGEIVSVLLKEHIKELKSDQSFPKAFNTFKDTPQKEISEESDHELIKNPNRPTIEEEASSEESSDSEDE